jgi:hypothetical protein
MQKILFMLLLLMSVSFFVFAQQSTGITGKLVNNKEEAIANVSITVTKKGNSVLLKGTISSATGSFSLQLLTGSYSILL